MSFWQKKPISKRSETVIRNVCAVFCTLAAVIFNFIFVGMCLASTRTPDFKDWLFALSVLGALAFFSSYMAFCLWRDFLPSSQQDVVAKLQALDFHSIEFYDVATRYFYGRLLIIHNCGLFFVFMAVLSLEFVYLFWGRWNLVVSSIGTFCCSAVISWGPFRIGKYGIRLIKAARRSDTQHQLDTLLLLAKSKPFRSDPVGLFIRKQVGGDAAC
jgi:hypothetical protein